MGASVVERVPLAMITRRDRSASFVAVLEPVKNGRPYGVKSLSLAQEAGGYVVSVDRAGGTDRIWVGVRGVVEL